LTEQPGYPTLELEISRVLNLFSHLDARGSGPAAGAPGLVQSMERLARLRSYSPGVGLWGFFEEALAASQDLADLDDNIEHCCVELRRSVLAVAEGALEEFETEWQTRRAVLERRRTELAPAWATGQQAVMEEIKRLFSTPWEGADAERIAVSLVYATGHAAKSSPFVLGVAEQPVHALLADMVHELLHRNSFGSTRTGLWSKLQLYYFSTGVPAWLGHEVTHTIITWAGCTISARVWSLDLDKVYHGFYDDTISPRQSSLDALADIWRAYDAGQMKPMQLMRQATEAIAATFTNEPGNEGPADR